MSGSDKPALSALVSPRSVEQFLEQFWPDKSNYFLVEGDPARLPEFLQCKELSSFNSLMRAHKGQIAFSNGMKSSHMLPIDRVFAPNLLKMGLTIFFDDITPYIPGAVAFVRQLEADLGINEASARATAWVSPSENGAACHYDADDIISIQLRGTKRFELAPVREISNPYGRQHSPESGPPPDGVYPQMTDGFPDWQSAEFQTIEMKPGSVLFFHRGLWHRTYASADSLAVSIVMEPLAAIDCVLEQLRLLLIQDPKWRRPLYGAWGNKPEREAALAKTEGLIKEIPRIAGLISAEDTIVPTLPADKRLALIDRNSRFQKVPNVGISLEVHDGSQSDSLQWIRIILRDGSTGEQTLSSIEVPREFVEVVSWLASQDAPFGAQTLEAKFPSIPFGEHKQLLENCVRGGLLKLLWFPALQNAEAR